MNNTKTQGQIAGLCFFLPVMYTNIIYPIIIMARYYEMTRDYEYLHFDFFYNIPWSTLVLGIISIIFAVSLFIDNIQLAKTSRIIVCVAFTASPFVCNLFAGDIGGAISIIIGIIGIVVEVLTVIAIDKLGERAQKLCYISMGLLLVQRVILSISLSSISFIGVITTVVTMAGYFFLGKYLSGKVKKAKKVKNEVEKHNQGCLITVSGLLLLVLACAIPGGKLAANIGLIGLGLLLIGFFPAVNNRSASKIREDRANAQAIASLWGAKAKAGQSITGKDVDRAISAMGMDGIQKHEERKKIVTGAVVGGVVAGDIGAVAGAVAAKAKIEEEKLNKP